MPDITSTTGKSARDQLRDLAEAAKEFSGYGPGFDMIMNGIDLLTWLPRRSGKATTSLPGIWSRTSR